MSALEAVNRVRRRFLVEAFDLDPVVDPPVPRADRPALPAESQEAPEELHLRVLSLNVWGIPTTPNCTERAAAVAKAIEGQYDIVVLQEVWHRRERCLLINTAEKGGFHYYHYFHPAIGFPVPFGADSFGTGLLVLSRFPISSALYHSFSLSGRPYALHEADFVANKGVGLLRVQTIVGQVDLYVTHLLANYNDLGRPGPGDRYLSQRVGQSYELARFITSTTRSNFVLVCGDFNSPSDCLVLEIPRVLAGLRDAYTDTNSTEGLTFATHDNKYSHGDHPMRMDYILYRINNEANSSLPRWQLVASEVHKSFFMDDRGEECPLSDHFGVMAEFVFDARRTLPCEQALGEDSMETPQQLSSHMCPTITCIRCDDDGELKKKGEYSATTACLHAIQSALLDGRKDAAKRRSAHLNRSALCLIGLMTLIVLRLSLLESNWLLLVMLFLTFQMIIEYIMAFYSVTLECSNFTELANQVRLHLHAEQAKELVY